MCGEEAEGREVRVGPALTVRDNQINHQMPGHKRKEEKAGVHVERKKTITDRSTAEMTSKTLSPVAKSGISRCHLLEGPATQHSPNEMFGVGPLVFRGSTGSRPTKR